MNREKTNAGTSAARTAAERYRLILLFGMPRAGTTWLGKIFDSHRDSLYRHEPDGELRTLGIPLLPTVGDAERFRATIEGFADGLRGNRSIRVCAKLPLFDKNYYSTLRFALFRFSALLAKSLEPIARGMPVWQFVDYDAIPDLPVAWKSIESLGRLGILVRLLPSASAVVLIRHPCGYVASVLRGEAQGSFSAGTPASEDWGMFEELVGTVQAKRRGLSIADLKAMHPARRLAWRWALFNEKAMDDIDGLPRCLVVRYEDLCVDPQAVTRRLFAHTGLEWSQQTEEFLTRSTSADHGGYYSVFKNPVHSMNKWREQLAPGDIDRIMEVVHDSRPGRLYESSGQSAKP